MRGVRVFICYARMYSGNSVRLNKTKIRWKGIFLEVCVVFNLYLGRFIRKSAKTNKKKTRLTRKSTQEDYAVKIT